MELGNDEDDGSCSVELSLFLPYDPCQNCFHKERIIILSLCHCHRRLCQEEQKKQSGPTSWRSLCLPGVCVKDEKGKLPILEWPSCYQPLWIFQIGSDEAATRMPRTIKRAFRSLGQLVKASGPQLQGMMKEEMDRAKRIISGLQFSVIGRILIT